MTDLRSRVAYRNTVRKLTTHDAAIASGSIVTAVPVGRDWRVKTIAEDGEVTLLGRFDGRLSALGAALVLSVRCGGRAVP
jgi:hypothetical protein